MKLVILVAFVALAAAAPERSYTDEKSAPILKDERIQEDDGRYNYDVETGNGIIVSQSGAPNEQGTIKAAGHYSYTSPEGTFVELKYVANENGYQPQSDHLPVAPEFPHEIPQFVLDQIAFAAAEDAEKARSGRYDS